MADAITSFFLLPQASRIGGSAAARLAPTALELGADNLTFNARREVLGKLFTSPSSASNLKNLDSFLSLHAASSSAAPALRATGKDTLKATPELKKNDSAALDVFIQRETSAEARLKELLAGTAATTSAAVASSVAEETAAAEPAITRNTGLRVQEGGEGIISNLRLNADIAGARPQDIIYTVSDGPRNGRLELASNPGKAVTTFTQQDLDLGRLRYINNGAEARGDSFDFTVNAGERELSGSFGIGITPVNDTPVVAVNEGLTLDEGASAILYTAQLSVSDPDNNASETVFTVTQSPQYGRLELTGNAGVSITSFTQADIAAGRVRYVSDGSEVTSDSFTFSAGDGAAATTEETFAITVNPVDDSATVITNTGAAVTEGDSTVITASQLTSTDVDTPDTEILYNVTAAPSDGYLEFTDDAGTAITSFTQADINAGRVRYVNDGSEASTDSFTFTVTGSTATTASASFAFSIDPVDDAPTAGSNTGVTAAEGGATTITSAQLGTTDVDTAAANITYTVNTGPAHGRLEFTDNAGVAVTSFTQADIDSGRLRYVHDGSETTSDSFTFTASDATTALAPATFGINVTPVDDASVISNNGGAVVEGSSSIITSGQLQAADVDTAAADITYTITSAPTNGRLESTLNPGVSIASFTQADIDAGRIRFVHDGSEAATASFGFSVSDGTTLQAGNTFSLAVTPVNDAPVQAANTGTTLVRQTSTIITSTQLQATDVDNTSSSLTYSVTTSPLRGRLELTTDPGVSITSFTQADIDAGRLRYVHTGLGVADDSFTFALSDGGATLGVQTFNIDVTLL